MQVVLLYSSRKLVCKRNKEAVRLGRCTMWCMQRSRNSTVMTILTRVQRLLVRSLQPSLITPNMTSCMACVCVCLLPRLCWPEFSLAVACLAQSQELHCLYNQVSQSLERRTTIKLSVPVDVCFSVDSSFHFYN